MSSSLKITVASGRSKRTEKRGITGAWSQSRNDGRDRGVRAVRCVCYIIPEISPNSPAGSLPATRSDPRKSDIYASVFRFGQTRYLVRGHPPAPSAREPAALVIVAAGVIGEQFRRRPSPGALHPSPELVLHSEPAVMATPQNDRHVRPLTPPSGPRRCQPEPPAPPIQS